LQSGMHDKAFYQNLWKTILNGEPYRGTIINKKKNGEFYWSEQTITPMKDDAGNITNFVSVLKDITELKEKQEQEFQLRIARELQQRYYKVKASIPGFDIVGATYSAVETNGDYFDFISMTDGSIGMVIGDVSGHGVGAALIMAQTRAYLRAFAKVESDPGVLLTWLNQELAVDLDKEHYVTLILARLDPNENLLDYASAGHLSTYLLNGSGEVRHVMQSTGIPLGIMRNYKFAKSESIKLTPSDIVFFLTDGITEAQALDETEFGVDRTLDVIKRHRKAPAKKMMEHLYQAVRSFSQNKPQEDDITSIICKVI
ncbi:MAG: SpoIIE family protein phosphatase, partial [bacterium]